MISTDTAPAPRRPTRHLLGAPLAAPGPAERRRERARHLLGRDTVGTGPVGASASVTHAALGAALALVGWFLVGLTALATLRGPFYGLVEPGPYDRAWGGPSLAGAWAVHAAVWASTVPVLVLLLAALAGLHARLTAHLLGGRQHRWAVPVAVLVVVGAPCFACEYFPSL